MLLGNTAERQFGKKKSQQILLEMQQNSYPQYYTSKSKRMSAGEIKEREYAFEQCAQSQLLTEAESKRNAVSGNNLPSSKEYFLQETNFCGTKLAYYEFSN